jgi:hypothetical protein
MPARAEGSIRLAVNNVLAVFMSVVAIAAAYSNETSQDPSQLGVSTETPNLAPQPEQTQSLGSVALQNNFNISIGIQHFETTTTTTSTTTTTTQPETDANSTNTPDWRCIKQAEGSNPNGNYTQISGAFGFKTPSWIWTLQQSGIASPEQYPIPGSAPPLIQNEAALFLLAYHHYVFKGPWNNYCTEEGLVR